MTPDPVTAPPAFYIAGRRTWAFLARRDQVVKVRAATGTVIDEVPAAVGDYVVSVPGSTWTERRAEFEAVHSPVPGTKSMWFRKSLPKLLVQPLDGPDAFEFLRRHVRCARDGTIFCSTDAPLSQQARLISEAVADPDLHPHARAALIADADLHMQALAAASRYLKDDMSEGPFLISVGDEAEFDSIASGFGGPSP